MTEELKQKIDKIVRDYYTSPKALALYRNLKGLAYDVATEVTKELEKENAELKEEMNAKQVVLNDFKSRVETVTDRFNRKSSQLTKAKELIEDMYDAIPSSHSDYYKDVMERARQFLSEVEK